MWLDYADTTHTLITDCHKKTHLTIPVVSKVRKSELKWGLNKQTQFITFAHANGGAGVGR